MFVKASLKLSSRNTTFLKVISDRKQKIANSPSMFIAVASGDRSFDIPDGFQGSRLPFTNTTLDMGRLRPRIR